ncbi:amidohydrolase family protein [Blastopirellula sp. J2-11]|uniref:amidohydrolase family protein n=1 Tax=Blastopirellula sp. J2-11 TaxID=2943192 RepID=UPI0021C8E002|nr:amidohydrolase family protein [Blastopirellula sp. J2-11]UUO06193.1 amidohydrolase family protein [Blastopirellula sp. J2-11]
MTVSAANVTRRDFLTLISAGGLLSHAQPIQAEPAIEAKSAAPFWVDVNVYLSRWPFRRLRDDTPDALASMLRSKGITQAWTGSFDGVFHKDIGAVNRRLSEACAQHGDGLFIPFGSINPLLPQWQDELHLCAEKYQMPGIRLHPNYHGYDLKEARFQELLQRAAERNLIVQLCGWLEDPRTQHPQMRVPTVNLAPLGDLAASTAGLRLVLLNGVNSAAGKAQAELLNLPNVYCDIAQLESSEGVSKLLATTTAEHLLFGSYSPMFYFDSARLKLAESVLTPQQEQAIRFGTAHTLLPA